MNTSVLVKSLNKQHQFKNVNTVIELFHVISNEWKISTEEFNIIYMGDFLAKKGLNYKLSDLNKKELTVYISISDNSNRIKCISIIQKLIQKAVIDWLNKIDISDYDYKLKILYNMFNKKMIESI